MERGQKEPTSVVSDAPQPETEFAEFYCSVISKLYDLNCRQILKDAKSAIIDMRRLKYDGSTVEKIFFSFKPPPVKCAYIYAYSVLHSTMVYSEFSNFLKQNPKLLAPAFNQETLKLCCLGGGPATEAVAICKAISDFNSGFSRKSDELQMEVCVTVVDKLPHWKREESAVIKAANNSPNLLDPERVILHDDFMKADLLKPFDKELREKIKQANIVAIVKFGASIQDKSPEDCKQELQNLVENVIESMDEGSLLFMLDNAGGDIFYSMMRVLSKESSPSRLGKSLHKEYCLDPKTLKIFEGLMNPKKDTKYRPILPTGKGKISSCLWIKNIIRIKEKRSSQKEKEEAESDVNTSSSPPKSAQLEENPVPKSEEFQRKGGARKAKHPSAVSKTGKLNKKGKMKDKTK